jgi:hypothetical protein
MEVRILALPLALYRRSSEYHDELMREFALLVESQRAAIGDAPAELVRVSEALRARFSGFTSEPNRVLEHALLSGAESVDLTYRVPREARDAAVQLAALFDAADDFCRQGNLLTLAAPGDVRAFRTWFLQEFVAQIDGSPPTPWAGAS